VHLMGDAPLVLKGRYEVERELGRGGMSAVYLARDRELLSKHVVVKVLLEETQVDPWIRQKFQQEMEALARIDHPGVVGVLDHGLTPEGKQFLVMQYIEGQTLRRAIEAGSMNFRRAAGLIRQMGNALAAAHEKGVWHRDLKPENVMLQALSGEEHVKLIDFGIAGIQNSQFGGEQTKIAGSLSYMAPEQFAGHPSAASDTYALGVIAYEMLTGKKPFASDSMMHLAAEDTRVVRPSALRPELPEAAERSIGKAMSFREELRQGEVREFTEELYQALAGGETTRKPAAPGTVEIAHVLFTDLVGYSLLPMEEQKEYLRELQDIVRGLPRFRAAEMAGELISLPTGDGMALAFFGDPTAPAQSALELASELKRRPHLKLRMGINSGPVYRVADVNANANVSGGGINLAQRVMDCGDAGHILVSKSVADVLLQLSHWPAYLTDLGECAVKHGVTVHLYNLATAELGNRKRPRQLAASGSSKAHSKLLIAVAATLTLLAAAGVFWLLGGRTTFQPAGEEPSVAVLPFADLSPEKNQEYFSEGMADELLNALAKIQGLRVAARTSSFQFGGKTEDVRVIGRKLNVAAILEGSVRKQANRVRITTQLIKASDGFHMWSDTYERDMNDIFAVQEEIAGAVTGKLALALMGGKTAPRSRKAADPAAYNAYLQGRYFLERFNQANLEKAAGYFEQAVQLDPGYAPAWVGLGESRSNQAMQSYTPRDAGFQQARQAAERAVALDPNLAEAHSLMGWIQMFQEWDWTGAATSLQRALALEPGNARMIGRAGILARAQGRLDDATVLCRRSMQIDPLSSGGFHNSAVTLYYAGHYDEAAAAFRKALELFPDRTLSHGYLGLNELAQSHWQVALAEMEQEKNPGLRRFGLALAYHALGRNAESDDNLRQLIEKDEADYQVAEAYAFRGEKDRAFEWLDKTFAVHDSGIVQLKGDPLFKSLERDPRYADLLKRAHLPI
jgi:serine/threonine protein kinase/TolB-like protein/cytochrome c-type biogenesis protein CcmH/NrfG